MQKQIAVRSGLRGPRRFENTTLDNLQQASLFHWFLWFVGDAGSRYAGTLKAAVYKAAWF